MSKKNPIRGLDPMSDYSSEDKPNVGSDKELLTAVGIPAGIAAGAGILTSAVRNKMAKEKAQNEAESKKSGISLDAENARKDARVKKEYDSYEKSKGMKKGGTASSRADGCAQRGKTRGKMV